MKRYFLIVCLLFNHCFIVLIFSENSIQKNFPDVVVDNREITSTSPTIYDCFTFFNELEILKIRLNEMYDAVDYFVLVESEETFRGAPKPLFFYENKNAFTRYKDKIIHIIVKGKFETGSPWAREAFQRNQIMRGLENCKKNDIILISDVDEIAAIPAGNG